MTLMESKKKHTTTYTAELHERGVRMYREHRYDYTSYNATYRAVATGLLPIKQSSKVPSYARPRARHKHVR
jgi:predicted amidohydrolase